MFKNAYGYNKKKLYNHWKNSGRSEGRRINLAFDLMYYLQYNQDLRNAFGTNYVAAYNHFLQIGYTEYRPMSHVFNCGYYRNHYSDLSNMTSYQAIQHFIYNGITEGRKGCAS